MRRELPAISKMPLSFSHQEFTNPIPYTTVATGLSRGGHRISFNPLETHIYLYLVPWCYSVWAFLEKHATRGHTIVFISNSSHYIWNRHCKALLCTSPPFAIRLLWSNFFQLSNSPFTKGYLEFCPFTNWVFVFTTGPDLLQNLPAPSSSSSNSTSNLSSETISTAATEQALNKGKWMTE